MYRTVFAAFTSLTFALSLKAENSAPNKVDQKTEPQAPAEVVVTATRTESDPHLSPYTVRELSTDLSVQKQFRTLPESLRELPGVMVQKTSNGQGSPFLRGFTGFRTLALIDGVRFNNSIFREGPNQYWNTIDGLALDNLEVILGQGSVLYGSDAIGGTVNLLTRGSGYQDEAEGSFFFHADTLQRLSSAEQSWIGRLNTELGVGQQWGLHLGASLKDFGDVRAADLGTQRFTGYDEWSYDARLDVQLDPNWELTLAHQALEQDDVWRTHSTIFGVSFEGTTIGSDRRRIFDQSRSLSYAKLKGKDLKGPVQQAQLTLSYQNGEELQDRVRRDGRGELSGHDIDTLGLDLQLESDTPIGYLVYGLDYYHDSVDSFRTDFIEGTTKRKARIQGPVADDSSYDLLGVYLQDDITLTEKVHLYLGGRYTYAKAELGRFENPITKEAQSFSQSWNNAVFSARTELALDSEQHYILFGGVSQGFRAPNLSDLSRLDIARSGELEVGSTELDPEKFISYEIGVKARTDHFTGSFSYFYTSIQDIIARKPTGRIIEDQVEVTKANAGSGFVHGAELAGSWQITEQWNLFGNVTFIKGEADNFPGSTRRIQREPLSRIQPLTGTAGVRWTAKDQKVWAELVCTATARADDLNSADREDTQRIPPNGTPGYVLINLRSGWNVTKNVTLLASLDNVLNEAYRVHGSGSNEPGIGATLGVKLAF